MFNIKKTQTVMDKESGPKVIRLYMMGDNELYVNFCMNLHKLKTPIELLGELDVHDIGILKQVVAVLHPDVVFLSITALKEDTIKEITQIRIDHPDLGLVILLEVCNSQDTEQLHRLTLMKSKGGTAILLKRRLAGIDWLCSIVSAVRQGQLIIDAPLTPYMFAGEPGYDFLKKLTLLELEIISLLANGYTNTAIASSLCISTNTVEQQLNNMYSKLKPDNETNDEHLKVSLAKLYRKATKKLNRSRYPTVRSPANHI